MTEFPKIITATRTIDWPENRDREWWAGEVTFGKNPVTIQGRPFKYTHYIRLDLHERAVGALVGDISNDTGKDNR